MWATSSSWKLFRFTDLKNIQSWNWRNQGVSCCPQRGMLSSRSSAHRCKRERQDVCLRLNYVPITHMMVSAWNNITFWESWFFSFLPTFPLSFISSFFPSFLICSFPVVPGTEPSVWGYCCGWSLWEAGSWAGFQTGWLVSYPNIRHSLCSARVRGTELSPFQETMEIIESKEQRIYKVFSVPIHLKTETTSRGMGSQE